MIDKNIVSAPKRNVYDYLKNSEIYGILNSKSCIKMYCSDYRGDKQVICEQIKSYHEERDKTVVSVKWKWIWYWLSKSPSRM